MRLDLVSSSALLDSALSKSLGRVAGCLDVDRTGVLPAIGLGFLQKLKGGRVSSKFLR